MYTQITQLEEIAVNGPTLSCLSHTPVITEDSMKQVQHLQDLRGGFFSLPFPMAARWKRNTKASGSMVSSVSNRYIQNVQYSLVQCNYKCQNESMRTNEWGFFKRGKLVGRCGFSNEDLQRTLLDKVLNKNDSCLKAEVMQQLSSAMVLAINYYSSVPVKSPSVHY